MRLLEGGGGCARAARRRSAAGAARGPPARAPHQAAPGFGFGVIQAANQIEIS